MRQSQSVKHPLFRRTLFNYILFMVIPCILLIGCYILFAEHYFRIENEQKDSEIFEQYCSDIALNFRACEKAHDHLQTQANFSRFLQGFYRTDAEQLVAYFKEFRTMFLFAESESKYIKWVQVYPFRKGLMCYNNNVRSSDLIDDYEPSLRARRGYWIYDSDTELFVYSKTLMQIYSSADLALTEVHCFPLMITDKLSAYEETTHNEVYLNYDAHWFEITPEGLNAVDKPFNSEKTADWQIEGTDFHILTDFSGDSPASNGSQDILMQLAVAGIALLGLLSIFFFIPVSRLFRRIVAFSDHLSAVSAENTHMPFSDQKQDEFGMLVTTFNSMLTEKKTLVDQIELERLRRSEMGYRMLQAQIDPHFIYNVLENLRMMAEMCDESDISEMVYSLSRLLRYTFSVDPAKYVSMDKELDLVGQYLTLQKVRLSDRLDYSIACPHDVSEIKVPQFTIQPLVENAFKHGFTNGEDIMRLTVDIARDDPWVIVRVCNSGSVPEQTLLDNINGILAQCGSLQALSSGTGVGLDNINRRMRYLYPCSFSIMLFREEHGKTLTVEMKWQPDERNDAMKEAGA